MYLSYFGLDGNPFSITPNPRFLFLAASHRDALAELREHAGVVVVTGGPGTGKTTLLLALREGLDADTAVSYVFNTTLPFEGIVELMLDDLGIAKLEESPECRLEALTGFLSERERAGQSTTLIIDEAQNLDVATLAQLGTLATLEGLPPSHRLRLLLVGTPELEARLGHPDLRHLRERIGLSLRIRPLDTGEVRDYIHSRLWAAGAPDMALFDAGAIGRIGKCSRGIPRVINLLADHCLLIGYADQKRRIDRHIANRAIAYLKKGAQAPRMALPLDGPGTPRQVRRVLKIAGLALVSALAGFALSVLTGHG